MAWIDEHIGEERTMNNGQKAKIISGNKYTDITVQFESGIVRDHVTYQNFKKGTICNVQHGGRYINKEIIMRNGLVGKIIGRDETNYLTVQFEDGIIVHHVNYSSICGSAVKHPTLRTCGKNVVRGSYLGTFDVYRIASKSQVDKSVYYECKCRECGFSKNLTPQEMLKHQCNKQRKENKEKVTEVSWINEHIGEERIMSNGQRARIIGGTYSELTIEFEDGTVVENRQYDKFIKGVLKNPNYIWIDEHLGEERIMSNGQRARIIGGKNSSSFTVQFEDETIVEHAHYSHFLAGKIRNPNYSINKHIGDERIMNNGQRAKIIGGTDLKSLTIQFDDGTIVKNKTYYSFLSGNIGNPNCAWISEHLGEKKVMKNGLKIKIIGGKSTDLTVKFEDGVILQHKTYSSLCEGSIGHPTIKIYNGNVGDGSVLGTFNISKTAFKDISKQKVYYECQCKNCRFSGILTPQEMLRHKCKGRTK